MTEEWDDEWGMSSGLPLADADVEIIKFEFCYNADIAKDAVFAGITFEDLDTGEEAEQFFSVGDGWEPQEKGALLGTESGKPRKLSKNSNYGRLVTSAIECVGGGEALSEIGIPGFRFAEGWIGTRWHTDTVEVETSRPGEDETKKRDRIVFTDYLGQSDGADASEPESEKKPAKKAAAKKAPAKKTAAKKETSDDGIEPELRERLLETAKSHDSHDDFLDDVLEWEGVSGVKDIERALMKSDAGSLWAEARDE